MNNFLNEMLGVYSVVFGGGVIVGIGVGLFLAVMFMKEKP